MVILNGREHLTERRKFEKEEIAAVFSVPPQDLITSEWYTEDLGDDADAIKDQGGNA